LGIGWNFRWRRSTYWWNRITRNRY